MMINNGRRYAIMTVAQSLLIFGLLTTTNLAAEEQATTASTIPVPTEIMVNGNDYVVAPRKPHLSFYPCTQCHKFLKPNPLQRELFSPHPHTLEHGGGRFWCLTCHDLEDRDHLRRVDGLPIDFDNAPELCASCHMARYRDWKGGAHGKRVGNWQGERVIWACPECHNPHNPTIKPRAAKPPPPVRRDLEKPELAGYGAKPVWDRQQEEQGNE